MIPIKKILCPTDFSEPSYKALKIACDLAESFSSELILIHVLKPAQTFPAAPSIPPAMGGEFIPMVSEETRDHARKSLDMTLEERVSGDINSHSILADGNPAEEIVRNADELKADVIVIGTHGFTGWRHLLLGSVAEKVVRLASCPVITIPAHEKE